MSLNKNSGVRSNFNRPNWKFYNDILEKEDIRPFIDCMTCGKCVGDCIAARNSEFNSRKIIQKILDNNREDLINSEEIWRCFLCDLCTIKCPKKIEIKKLMLILRKLAMQSGKGFNLLKYISDFPKSFLENGLILGRVDKSLREKLGLTKEINLSEKTKEELNFLLEKTGQKKAIETFLEQCSD
jgi:heterodisulfide reductase subunit C